eukprot:GHVS01098660.1.p1 GENE.GHVS01098660.1~~GHVS01098660.1.p1  ORF type:complete len:287 (-),score=17.98 GHVS01098660.1:244-1104(-)
METTPAEAVFYSEEMLWEIDELRKAAKFDKVTIYGELAQCPIPVMPYVDEFEKAFNDALDGKYNTFLSEGGSKTWIDRAKAQLLKHSGATSEIKGPVEFEVHRSQSAMGASLYFTVNFTDQQGKKYSVSASINPKFDNTDVSCVRFEWMIGQQCPILSHHYDTQKVILRRFIIYALMSYEWTELYMVQAGPRDLGTVAYGVHEKDGEPNFSGSVVYRTINVETDVEGVFIAPLEESELSGATPGKKMAGAMEKIHKRLWQYNEYTINRFWNTAKKALKAPPVIVKL